MADYKIGDMIVRKKAYPWDHGIKPYKVSGFRPQTKGVYLEGMSPGSWWNEWAFRLYIEPKLEDYV
jgi:hypothetical protein